MKGLVRYLPLLLLAILWEAVARLGLVLVTGCAQRQRDGQREEVLLARRPRDVRAVLRPQPDAVAGNVDDVRRVAAGHGAASGSVESSAESPC